MMFLAGSVDQEVARLPWWEQGGIGLGLVLLAVGLSKFNKRDNGEDGGCLLSGAALLCGIAGLVVLAQALFGQ